MCVQGGLDKQGPRTRMFVGSHSVGNRKRREAFEPRGLNEIQRQVVGYHAAHGDADQHVLHHERKDDECRDDSAGGGDGERLEHIFKYDGEPRPHPSQRLPRGLRLGRAHANASRKIGRRQDRLNVSERNDKPPIALQQASTLAARFDMLPDGRVIPRRDRAIEITGQIALGTFAIHRRHPLTESELNIAEAVATAGWFSAGRARRGTSEGASRSF